MVILFIYMYVYFLNEIVILDSDLIIIIQVEDRFLTSLKRLALVEKHGPYFPPSFCIKGQKIHINLYKDEYVP